MPSPQHLTKPKKGTRRASRYTRVMAHMLNKGGPRLGTWLVGHLTLDSCPTEHSMKQIVADRILDMSKFRSVIVANKKRAGFNEVAEIDWDYHLKTVDLRDGKEEGATATKEDIMKHTADVLAEGLDLKKPLWKIHLVPSYGEGNKGMVIFIFGHALADGVAAIGVLLKMIDDSPIDPTVPIPKQRKKADERTEVFAEKRGKKPKVGVLTKVGAFFGGVKKGVGSGIATHDPPNALKLKITSSQYFDETLYAAKKRFGRSENIALDEIKAIKNKFKGATVNDVLAALMVMTVRKFLEEKKDPVVLEKRYRNRFRATFPVSMRPKSKPILYNNNPGNCWEALTFPLPLQYSSPIDCVWKTKRTFDRKKNSPELKIQGQLTKLGIRFGSTGFLIPMAIDTATKSSLMFSNVPGPQRQVHLDGKKVEEIDFFLSTQMGTYLGVLTYNGQAKLSTNIDQQLNVDPEDIIKHWIPSFEELSAQVAEYPNQVPRKVKKRK